MLAVGAMRLRGVSRLRPRTLGCRVRAWVLLIAGACALVAAPASTALAFRTNRDLPGFGQYARVTWERSEVQFVVTETEDPAEVVEVMSAVGGFAGMLERLQCASVRVSVRQSSLPFDLASHLGDGQSSITIVGGVHWTQTLGLPAERMAVTELAYVPLSESTLAIVEADILLNAEQFVFELDPSADDEEVKSLRAVLSHELMHSLGMAHACENFGIEPGAPLCDETHASLMMHPSYMGAEQQHLASDDAAGVCALYPASTCEGGCASGFACVDRSCRALCGARACKEGETCDAGLCRAPCGGALCAAGDVCEGETCRAVCGGSVCPAGTVCTSGVDGVACTPSCFGGPCATRTCGATSPCPEGLDCAGAVCRTRDDGTWAACRKDRDCTDPAALCRYGACVLGSGASGDPCVGDAACRSGWCSDGRCRDTCGVAGCGVSESCDERYTTPLCVPANGARDLGEPCASGAECSSSLCLEVGGAARACTRRCASPDDDCPRGYVCSDTEDGERICAVRALARTGCASSQGLGRAEFRSFSGMLFVLFVGLSIRAGRRSSRSR